MRDVCYLHTTAYHPQCDGMVERLNRTLKGMLGKTCAMFGRQWDQIPTRCSVGISEHTPRVDEEEAILPSLWKSLTKAALLFPQPAESIDLADYREKLMLSLATARELAVQSIKAAQSRYRKQYDKRAKVVDMRVGDWVFVRFPQDETGNQSRF